MEDLTGEVIGGRYKILQKLGEGGMASVYMGEEMKLGRKVALKFIRHTAFGSEVMAKVRKRFEREAFALAQLTHPNIIPVIDCGEHEGSPYLVMPYLAGGTLRQLLGRKMKLEEAARLLLPLAQALAYAHGKGVVHRDVKPGNILLSESGQPLLADFGIVRLLEDADTTHLTSTGMGVGTPEYMAPEQWRGEITPQVDVYALGVVLYEMLSGEKPYTGKTPGEVLLKQMSEPLPDVRQKAEGLSAAGAALVQRALARDVSQRFASMEEFAAALEGALRGEEVVRTETAPHPVELVTEQQKMPAPPDEEETHDDMPETGGGRHLPRWVWGLGVIGLAGVMAICFLSGRGLPGLFAAPKPTITPPVPALGAGSTVFSEKDGMELVYVPQGEFEMGSNDGYDHEKPVHTVYLDAFWIDRTEVTNAMYAKCVQGGACQTPYGVASYTRDRYYGDTSYADYPVIYVDWFMADAYCKWAGRRLPTEAEWEKAARGTDGRKYPWGNNAPSCNLANYDAGDDCVGDTSAVGSYPQGASPYGALDMAGNVLEWVADWYDAGYYDRSPYQNPPGPSSGVVRVLRGGSWGSDDNLLRAAIRLRIAPSYRYYNLGFRCVR